MSSVRLTLDWGTDQQCVIDCAAEKLQSFSISFQDRHGRDNGRNGAVGEANRAADAQADGVNSVLMPDGADALEVSNRRSLGANYDGARNSIVSHGFPQNSQAKPCLVER